MLTARTEITDQMLIFGQRHLQLVLAEYEGHYNGRRPHHSRPAPPAAARPVDREFRCMTGHLLRFRLGTRPTDLRYPRLFACTGKFGPPFHVHYFNSVQLSVHTGSRFCRKACTPSRASLD